MKESKPRFTKEGTASATARRAGSVGMSAGAPAVRAAKQPLAIAVERRRPSAEERRRYEDALGLFLTELVRRALQGARERRP